MFAWELNLGWSFKMQNPSKKRVNSSHRHNLKISPWRLPHKNNYYEHGADSTKYLLLSWPILKFVIGQVMLTTKVKHKTFHSVTIWRGDHFGAQVVLGFKSALVKRWFTLHIKVGSPQAAQLSKHLYCKVSSEEPSQGICLRTDNWEIEKVR